MTNFDYQKHRFKNGELTVLSATEWDALVDQVETLEHTLNRIHLAGPENGHFGKVGIGTGAPEAQLQIVNKPQNADGDTLILGPTKASNLRLGYHEEYSWVQSHGGKPLAINPKGNNVGIGVANPKEKLHVGGTVFAVKLKASSYLEVGKAARFHGDIKDKDNRRPIVFQRFSSAKFRYFKSSELAAGKLSGHSSYSSGRTGLVRTGFSTSDYGAGIIGFDSGSVDINENGTAKFISMEMTIRTVKINGQLRKEWFVQPYLRTHQGTVAKFSVDVFFVSRQMCELKGY